MPYEREFATIIISPIVVSEENDAARGSISRMIPAAASAIPIIFVRASRSHIVNLRAIKSLHTLPDGGLVATLTSGVIVGISRRQSRKLREMLSP